MNKISSKVWVAVAVLLFSVLMQACNYLDVVPDEIATIDDAFADRYTAEQYLATCYWSLPKSAGWDQNPAMLGSMEIIENKDHRNSLGMRCALGENTAVSALINYWGGTSTTIRSLYAGIRECNTFLDNIYKVGDLEQAQKDRMAAEVKMLKAYMHFYQLTYYGPIPLLKESQPVNESTEGVRVYREKIDDCFEYVLQLLDEVINSQALPDVITNRSSELGRFTRSAAHMLKARVLCYWASDFYNGNTEMSSFKNQNGEPFFNQTYDATRWDKAKEACRLAIEECLKSGIRLYQRTDYQKAKPMSDTTEIINTLRSAVSEQMVVNVETIWGNTSYPCGSNVQRHCMPRLEDGSGSTEAISTLAAPLHTTDWFYSDNGLPLEEDADWFESGRYATRFEDIRTGDEEHRFLIQPGEQTSAANFDREFRYYAALGFDRGKWYGNSYKSEPVNDADALFPKARYGEYSNRISTTDYSATGYWIKKLLNFGSRFRDANATIWVSYPYPDMRFADLLLLYAEAINEATPGDDNAAANPETYTYVDMIRARAGLNGVVDTYQNYAVSRLKSKPSTKGGMRAIIRRERKVELAYEGQDFWDNKRWKTALKEQNRLVQGWNVTANDADPKVYYTPTTVYIQRFTMRDYLAPIPESDLINNPLLIQNPGW